MTTGWVIDRDRVSALVSSAQAGDEPAFAELVRLHQDRAVAYATAILGDYHLAQDAAQEAFVEAFRQLRSLREPAAFGSWLRTIVFKHCDRLTRGRRLPTSGLESALEVASGAPSPYEALDGKAWAQRRGHGAILRLLDEYERPGALPPRRREQYEALARDLIDAYGPGDPSALQRIIESFRAERVVAWDRPPHDVRVARVRKAVLAHLGDRRSAETTDTSLAPDDARRLIARAEGFEDWDALAAELES